MNPRPKLATTKHPRRPSLDTHALEAAEPVTRPVITIDPATRFGRPHIHGISVEAIAERVWAEQDTGQVADDCGITHDQVLLACWHEGTYGTRRHRAAWGGWALDAHRVMATSDDWDAIPDPPAEEHAMTGLIVTKDQIQAGLAAAPRTPRTRRERRKHLWIRGPHPLRMVCSRTGCDVVWYPHQRATVHGSCTGTDPVKENTDHA